MSMYFGAAPMLAMSLMVTAALIQPICQSVMPSTKSVVLWSISVVATITWSPHGSMAQSSRQFSSPMIAITVFKSSRSSMVSLPPLSHFLTTFALVLLEHVLDPAGFFLMQKLRLFFLPEGEGRFDTVFGGKALPAPHLHTGIHGRQQGDAGLPEFCVDLRIAFSGQQE